MAEVSVALPRTLFGEAEAPFLSWGDLRASLFRYASGVDAVRLANQRGEVVVLPFLGQMIWSARFAGVELAMRGMFPMPRPAATIIGTYGCFAFHSGLLRNGVPGPEDDHPVHGEFPCLAMDRATLTAGEDDEGKYLRLVSEVDYAQGFGAHYRASPHVTLRAGTLFDIAMNVENLSFRPMDLMYMCHINFAFVPGGRIEQPLPFTPEATVIRRAVPAHVHPDPAYLARIAELAAHPERMAVLDQPGTYDPEQVFYLRGLKTDSRGVTHLMLRRPERDAFAIGYKPHDFPKTVRWILENPDQAVAAFALPATCEPEGYAAERRKGNIRALAPGETARFEVRTGYLDAPQAAALARKIAALGG